MKKFIKVIVVLLIFMLSLSLFGCAKNSSAPHDSIDFDSSSDASNSAPLLLGQEGRKIIYNVSMSLQVSDIGVAGKKINDSMLEFGGRVQSFDQYGTKKYSNAVYVFRIPTEKLDIFLEAIEGSGEVSNKSISSEDITTQYVAATARVEALTQEKEALNSLVLTEIADILERSARISQINAELGALEKEINNYDSLVDYSVVTVRLYEQTASDNIPFGKKISNVFKASIASVGVVFKGLFIAFIAAIPYLAIIGAIIAIVFGLRHLLVKKGILKNCKLKNRKKKGKLPQSDKLDIDLDQTDK